MSYGSSATDFTRGCKQATPPSILVIGLGNPILGDDGVGWRVAAALQQDLTADDSYAADVEIDSFALGGLSLMERLVGYNKAIIIDAVQTGQSFPGQVHELTLEDLPDLSTGHSTAAHDTSLQTALRLGRAMGAVLPDDVSIIGIEAEQVYEFSEELTPDVAAAVPIAVQKVKELLKVADC